MSVLEVGSGAAGYAMEEEWVEVGINLVASMSALGILTTVPMHEHVRSAYDVDMGKGKGKVVTMDQFGSSIATKPDH